MKQKQDPGGLPGSSGSGANTNKFKSINIQAFIKDLVEDIVEFVKGKIKGTSKSINITSLARDEAREIVQNFLKNGKLNLNDLKNSIPKNVKNTFTSTERIAVGEKYVFELADGQKVTIRWHSPDSKASELYPGSSSGSGWTAQIKIGNKSLGADGKWYKNQSLDIVHIPITGR